MPTVEHEPEPGRYEHPSGGLYDVIACATVAAGSREGQRDVVYRNQQGEWFTRSVARWNQPMPSGRTRFVRITA